MEYFFFMIYFRRVLWPVWPLVSNRSGVRSAINTFTMATAVESTEVVSSCIFCQIIKENDPNKLIYEDEELVSFADIKPASKCHYLIVPRKHIKDAKELKTPEDKVLVEKMVEVAKRILVEKNCDLTDARFGFHWPPFHTVSHLHLHAISPASEMGIIAKMMFRQDSLWFVSPDYVISRL